MNVRLNEIDWAEPVLPKVENPSWEASVKKQMGMVPDILTRVSTCIWLREALLKSLRVQVNVMPRHLAEISTLVVAQENACRFCYGFARSQMKLFGYSDKMIDGIEQDMLMAELDQKDRTFIKFCRSLAKSNPRPPKTERDKLLNQGFSPLEVSEMSLEIARECFVNRIITFISSPPMYDLERLSDSFWGRLLRPLIARKLRGAGYIENRTFNITNGPFSEIMRVMQGVPAAIIFQEALDGAFNSNVLSPELKILMFAVVARLLGCTFCYGATHQMALDHGFSENEFSNALSTLASPRLNKQERLIFSWTRETVHYQTGPMQERTRQLASEIDHHILLEAIGVAALANSIVRLGVLLE